MAHIMIVHDDEDLVSALAKTLRGAGHEVEISLDTRSAEKRMEVTRPDLVILDVMFQGDAASGLTFARTIRHFNEKLKGIAVLMLTSDDSERPDGFGAGDIDEDWLPVACFVPKPVDLEALPRKVEDLLTQTGEQDGGPSAQA
ncbi:MAG: response regulator transcription factor [Planctomycetota bacterium]